MLVKRRRRYRRTGSVAPGKMGGHRKIVLEPYGDFIIARIEERWRYLGRLIATVTPEECANYLQNAGYASAN